MAKKNRIRGITIEIGGDTTKLQTALKGVNSQIYNTKSALTDVERLLKLDPGNTELLAQRHKLLGDAVSETKEKLETLRTAADQANSALAKGNMSQSQYDALQREIVETTQNLKELEKQAAQSGEAVQQIAAKGEKLKKLGGQIADVGETMTTHVTVPVLAAGAAVVKTTSDFDTGMSKVQAISGATGEEIDALREKAREMGAKTKFSASEAAAAMEYMAMAGWKTEDMLSGIDGIMNLAAASGEDLATTSDIVTDALTAFGMGTKDSAHFADVLAAASSNANTNVSMMGESFKYVAPAAGALGYSAEDVGIALGLMANSGIKADQAGTSLRNLFLRMAKPTKESDAAMTRLGLSLYDTQGRMYSLRDIMLQLRGSFQQINMPLEQYDARIAELDEALENGTIKQKEYDKELEELNLQAFGAEGAEKARAAAMLGGARAMSGLLAIANASDEDFNKLAGAIDRASDTYVKTKDGAVIPMSQALQEGKEWVEEYAGAAEAMSAVMLDNLGGDITILKSQLQELAISFGELIIPLLRDLVSWVQGVVTWLNGLDDRTKKIIITIAAVAAAIGPLLIIIGTLLSSIGQIMIWAPAIAGAATGIGAAIKTALIPAITGAVSTIVGTVLPAIGSVLVAIAPFLLGGAVVVAVVAGIVWIVKQWINNWDAIKALFADIGTDIRQHLSDIWNSIQSVFSSIWQGFSDFVSAAYNWGADMIANFVGGMLAHVKSLWNTVRGIAQGIRDIIGFSEPEEGPLSNFHTYAPDMMRLFAQGIRENEALVQGQLTRAFTPPEIGGLQPAGAASAAGNAPVSIPTGLATGQPRMQTVILQIGREQAAKLVHQLNDEEMQRIGVRLTGR